MLSPPQPQNTDTHTQNFLACRETQYEANKPIQNTPQSIKPKKKKKSKTSEKNGIMKFSILRDPEASI